MGVPTSEVGYTSAMPRREDHEVHKDMWGHWGREYIFIIIIIIIIYCNCVVAWWQWLFYIYTKYKIGY